MRLNSPLLAALALALAAPAAAAEIPANPEPRWWRGNLHTHTLWSDGDSFPETIVEWYRTAGYHFLALSDHNLLSQGQRWMTVEAVRAKAKGEPWRGAAYVPRDAFADYLKRFGPHWVETRPGRTASSTEVRLKPFDEYRALFDEPGRFLLISSEELTHRSLDQREIHMNATNLVEIIKPIDGPTVRDVINSHLTAVAASAARTGREILVHVNHPNYKWGVTAEDLAAVVRENFFEIWNGVEGDNDPGDIDHPSTDEIWDIANTLRLVGAKAAPLYAVATDDSHDYQGNKRRALPGRAWIMVRARHLSPETLIRAMRAGDFYASTGVTLDDVTYDAATRRLSLAIQAHGTETFVTRFVGTRRGVSLAGTPRRDRQGKIVETTLDYRSGSGPQIGEVFAEVPGLAPSYTLKGDELYVRAIVTSSGAPTIESVEAPHKRAWTQPVGWSVPASL